MSNLHTVDVANYHLAMSLKRRACARSSVPTLSLAAALCGAVLLTSVGHEGLLGSARAEFVKPAPVDQPLGDPAAELLQSREFAGFVSGRAHYTPLVVHAFDNGTLSTIPWPVRGAEQRRSSAALGQKLHSLYCVWIV
jgi:hypothetical protein